MSHTFYVDGHEVEATFPPAEYAKHAFKVSENGKRAVLGYITQDEIQDDGPRDWDNLGTMACYHRRYNLGDKNVPDMEEVMQIEKSKDYISIPLFLYDHSGITISATPFSCPWDSGRIGLLYVSKEKVRKEYGWKVITKERRAKIIAYLFGEVETYDQFLTGDVWGVCYDTYINQAEEGEEPEWYHEDCDSCWGFYGDNYAEEEMESGLKWWAEFIEKPLPIPSDPNQLCLDFKEAA